MPNITGEFYASTLMGLIRETSGQATGAFQKGTKLGSRAAGENGTSYAVDMDASRSSTVYGNSDTVQPPSIVLIPQIKF